MVTWLPFAVPLVMPSPVLSPREVVEAQLEALRQGDVRSCFEFASPKNRRVTGPWERFDTMVRRSAQYSPLVCCSSFEITSALALSDDSWTCRVRVRPAGSSSAPFAVADPVVAYRWELSRQRNEQPRFDLGLCVRHTADGWRGVVVGFDLVCQQPEPWISVMDIDALRRGRDQPFYRVLIDEADQAGAQAAAYVAEEMLLADTTGEPPRHPSIAELLHSYDAADGAFQPWPALRSRYPSGVSGCWMVDGVFPDTPASE